MSTTAIRNKKNHKKNRACLDQNDRSIFPPPFSSNVFRQLMIITHLKAAASAAVKEEKKWAATSKFHPLSFPWEGWQSCHPSKHFPIIFSRNFPPPWGRFCPQLSEAGDVYLFYSASCGFEQWACLKRVELLLFFNSIFLFIQFPDIFLVFTAFFIFLFSLLTL